MFVKVKKTEEVNLDLEECKKVALAVINKVYQVGSAYYINNGWLCYDYEKSGGPETWTETVRVRKATKREITILGVIAAIKNLETPL